jgi:hypothetical protein
MLESQTEMRDSLLWPNFAGFELAPTTAKYEEEKKARAVASVDILNIWKDFTYCE